jgi:hypothetical protein
MIRLLDALGAAVHDGAAWCAGVAREVGGSRILALAVVAAGLLVLLFGARVRRPIAALCAAALAALATGVLGAPVARATGVSPPLLAAAAAGVAGAAAALVPQVFPALAGALPGALVAEVLAPADRRWEVLAVGAVLGAIAGILLARLVASLAASAVGAVAVAVGAAGALRDAPAGRAALEHPVSIVAGVVLLAVAGAAFQYPRAWGRGGGKAEKGGGPPARGAAETGDAEG